MGGLLGGAGRMARQHCHHPQHLDPGVLRQAELMAVPLHRPRAVAQLQDMAGAMADIEQIDERRLRGPALSASRAVALAPVQIDPGDALRVAANRVTVKPVVRVACGVGPIRFQPRARASAASVPAWQVSQRRPVSPQALCSTRLNRRRSIRPWRCGRRRRLQSRPGPGPMHWSGDWD